MTHRPPFRDLGGEQIAEQVFSRRQSPASSSAAATVADDSITNAKLANMAASTIKARKTASTGDPEDCTLSEILDFIGSAAQGDILFRDASGWARLAAGTSGHFLKTQGAGANPLWASASGGGGLTSYGIADSGASAVTSFAYLASGGSAFSLNAKGWLILKYKLANVAGVAVNWRLFMNADTTTTNYYSNAGVNRGGSFAGGPANTCRTVDGPSGTTSSGFILIYRDYDGYVRWNVIGSDSLTTNLGGIFTNTYWVTTGVDVTDFIFSCTTASGTGAHSTLEVISP